MMYKREPINLLLVEDNADDAKLAKHELEDTGRRQACHVEHVWTGEQAIEAVQRIAQEKENPVKQFDVALIDLVLPGKSGLEAANHMVGFAPLLVIFICSGAVVPKGVLEEAIDKGFAVLPKPLQRAHVEMILNAVKVAKEKAPVLQ